MAFSVSSSSAAAGRGRRFQYRHSSSSSSSNSIFFVSPRNQSLPLFVSSSYWPKPIRSSSILHTNNNDTAALRPSYCSCNSQASLSSDGYHLISITERSDGSFVFRFGDASEIEENVEVENSRIIQKDDCDSDIVVDDASNKESESQLGLSLCLGQGQGASVGETALCREVSGNHQTDDPVAFSAVDFESKTNQEGCNVEMISYKILAPPPPPPAAAAPVQSNLDDGVMGRESRSGNDDVNIHSAANATLNLASSARGLFRVDGEYQGLSQSGSSAPNITVQVSDGLDGNVHTETSNTINKDGDTDDVIESLPVAFTSSEGDAILDEDSSPNIRAALVDDDDEIKPSKMLDGKLHSPNLKDEGFDGNACNRGAKDVSMSSAVQLHESGPALNREEILTKGFFLSSGCALLPNPSRAWTGGEDAYFVYENWLGVADGIGQWSLEGIEPGEYAQKLIENCKKVVSDSKYIPLTDPIELLNKAAVETQCVGSSTALVAYLDGQVLHVANIGDSGFLIIRNGTVYKRSFQMVHEFSFPLRMERGDCPSKLAERYMIDLDEGDIIIAATNGLFDNLYEQEICPMASHSLQAGLTLQEIAELLAIRAQEVGRSATVRSPFADAAQAAGYLGNTGGKLDDVTVIVSLVQSSSTSLS